MKRTSVIIVACALMLTVMQFAASAHGHGRSVAVSRQYSLCNVENCNTTGLHHHGDVYHYGHSIGDGHDYHQLCDTPGCTLSETHDHDGATYFAHYKGDGHNYHGSGSYGGLHH